MRRFNFHFKKFLALTVAFQLLTSPCAFAASYQTYSEKNASSGGLTSKQLAAAQASAQNLVDRLNLLTDSLRVASSSNQSIQNWFLSHQNAQSGLVTSAPENPQSTVVDGVTVYANTQAYTYDQALAGIDFLLNGNLTAAKKLFDFFYSNWVSQVQNGGFKGFWTVYNVTPDGAQYEYLRGMGETVWIGLFGLQYEAFNSSASEKSRALELATGIANWVASLPHTNGGVAKSVNSPSDPVNYGKIYSVENNLDYYAFLNQLRVLAPNNSVRSSLETEFASVRGWLKSAYDSGKGLFHRGGSVNASGQFAWDDVWCLDTNSWAITALGPDALSSDFGIDVDELALRIGDTFAVQEDGSFGGEIETAKGFDFADATNAARIGRTGISWIEGTNQMILDYLLLSRYYAPADSVKAQYYLGLASHFFSKNDANAIISGNNESYRHTDAAANVRIYSDGGLTFSGSSAAGTAWVYLASNAFNPFLRPRGDVEGETQTLVLLLQSDATRRNQFNFFFGTSVPASGPLSADDLILIYYLTGDVNFNAGNFFAALPKVIDLLGALQLNATALANFNRIFRTSIGATGAPSFDDRKALFDAVGSSAYDRNAFIAALPRVLSLYSTLQSNSSALSDFNLVFNTSIDTQRFSPLPDDREALFDAAFDPSFDVTKFLPLLAKTASLYKKIRMNPAPFNALFGTALSSTTPLLKNERKALFDVTGESAFNEASFIDALPSTAALFTAVQDTRTNRLAFNSLFGTTLRLHRAPTGNERKALFSVSGDPAFILSNFIAGLPKATNLYSALQGNTSSRNDFNALFATTISATGIPNAVDRKALFDVVADPAFDQTSFLATLPKAKNLYATLQSNPKTHLVNFNLLFGTTITTKGALTAANRTVLFNVAGPTTFWQATFLSVMQSTVTLMKTIIGKSADVKFFNRLFGVSLTYKKVVTPNVATRTVLFNIAGTPGYAIKPFLTTMRQAGNLLTQMQTNQTKNKSNDINYFNRMFGSNLTTTTWTPTDAQRTLLFNIAGAPKFSWKKFLPVLRNATKLLIALQTNTSTLDLYYFKRIYNATITLTVYTPNVSDRTLLFNIAGGSGFNLTKYLPVLRKTGHLYDVLMANDYKRGRFNKKYKTTLGSPLTGAQIGLLFGICGGGYYDEAKFLKSLG